MRSVPEWIGKNDDARIPTRVKQRIWVREGGRCYLTGTVIRPGDKYQFEHKIALCNGGEHRESNIFLALGVPHKEKTAQDRAQKKRDDRIIQRHAGIRSGRSRFPCGRDSPYRKKINGKVELR